MTPANWLEFKTRFLAAPRLDRQLDTDFCVALDLAPSHMQFDERRGIWFAHVVPDNFKTFEAPCFTADIRAIIAVIRTTLPDYRYMSVGGAPAPNLKAIGAVWKYGRFGADEQSAEFEEHALCAAYCTVQAELAKATPGHPSHQEPTPSGAQ